MAFTRFGVADLIGGVSTQPPALRFPNQLEASDNCWMKYARGLERRPGTSGYVSLANVPGSATEIACHWVEISPTKRVLLVFRNDATNPMRAYTLDGAAVTINWGSSTKAYVNVANPKTNLRFASLGVTTIVLNKTVTTATENPSGVPYQYSATNVSASTNAHNKATWDDFEQPPASASAANKYWYARSSTTGHPAGWWQAISTSALPWYEQVASEADNSVITASTMPIKVVYNTTTDQIDVSLIDWAPRYSGDENTNPRPDIFGQTLSDVAFHRGRLWLSAGDVVVSSQADDLYNLWVRDWENVVESDPISLSTSSTGEIANVTFLMPFRKSLMAFCDSGLVMEATSDGTLSPTTVVWQPSYRALKLAGRPDVMGNRLYYATDWSSGSKVYEHVASDTVTGGNAAQVSQHVDGYLPSGTCEIEVATDDMAFVRYDDETASLYVYQSLITGDQRVQSSYHRWTFHSDIASHFVFDNTLYLLMRSASTGWLETVDIADLRPEYDGELHHIHLDRKEKVTGTYSSATNLTTFTKSYSDTEALTAFCGVEWASLGRHGKVLSCTSTGGTTMTVPGNWSHHDVVVGRTYESSGELSEQTVRDPRNGSVVVGVLSLQNLSIQVRDTGLLYVDVTTASGDIRTEQYTGRRVGTAALDEYEIAPKGQFDVTVYEAADSVSIRLYSSDVTPFNITGLQIDGDFRPNARSAATK